MISKDDNVFDKIDALLHRRDSDLLVDRALIQDDFPTLTEILGEQNNNSSSSIEVECSSSLVERRLQERRVSSNSKVGNQDLPEPIKNVLDLDELLSCLEVEIGELFSLHQKAFINDLRFLIMDKIKNRSGSQ
jgi:hypothetical protein